MHTCMHTYHAHIWTRTNTHTHACTHTHTHSTKDSTGQLMSYCIASTADFPSYYFIMTINRVSITVLKEVPPPLKYTPNFSVFPILLGLTSPKTSMSVCVCVCVCIQWKYTLKVKPLSLCLLQCMGQGTIEVQVCTKVGLYLYNYWVQPTLGQLVSTTNRI